MSGVELVIDRCWWCHEPFGFHPGFVQSLLIDPATGLTPDLGGDPQRARREPMCPPCCKRANVLRREHGETTFFDERDSFDIAAEMERT